MGRHDTMRMMFAMLLSVCALIADLTSGAWHTNVVQAKSVPDTVRLFDIPQQPLAQALVAFDALSGLSVFFPSDLVAGRMSARVAGSFRSAQALELLLAGTGLIARRVAANAFVLAEIEPDEQLKQTTSKGRAYDALVQRRVQQALCTQPGLTPGSFRLALALHIDASGHVRRARLLDTTGQAARDVQVVQVLERLDMGTGPVDPGRPFVLLIRERPGASGNSCTDFLP